MTDIHGVNDPSELRYQCFDKSGNVFAIPSLGIAQAVLQHESGDSEDEPPHTDLDDFVRSVMLDIDPGAEPDGDGDFPVRFGSAMVFVRAIDSPPMVRFMSPLLKDVVSSDLLLTRLNDINTQMSMAKAVHIENEGANSVFLILDLPAVQLSSEQVQAALSFIGQAADDLDDHLHGEFGGRRFFDEETRPAATRHRRPGYL